MDSFLTTPNIFNFLKLEQNVWLINKINCKEKNVKLFLVLAKTGTRSTYFCEVVIRKSCKQ